MNKTRLEALSDGVFSIVMTLLVIELKVPEIHGHQVTDSELWQSIYELWPIFRSYIISFFVIGMYWVMHHSLFHMFVKQIDRVLVHMNNLFLMILAFLPFTAHLLGKYPNNFPSVLLYGMNIVLLGLTFGMTFRRVIIHPHFLHEHVDTRLKTQASIRVSIVPIFALMGIVVWPINHSLAYIFLGFPIIFNIIPGTLDFLENIICKRGKKHDSNP